MRTVLAGLFILALSGCGSGEDRDMSAGIASYEEDPVVSLLREPAAYSAISAERFETLGWDLPDRGNTVRALADAAAGSAFDPQVLEAVDAATLGYAATWHVIRFRHYDLDWDITALELQPLEPEPGLPTVAILHGGAANWYEFFIGPRNDPGLAQYLAQKIPVVLLSIPGNYKPGGWAESELGARKPAYLLDAELSVEETAIRNAVFTFKLVETGVKAALEAVVDGPMLLVGHSTGGELQFMLKDELAGLSHGLLLGWGTGGPAALDVMQDFRDRKTIDSYPHVSKLRARGPRDYARGYLGPLNPFWDASQPRESIADAWMGAEARRRPQFKQPLQDYEHSSADYLKEPLADEIRDTLQDSEIDAARVVDELFSTMDVDIGGYRRMAWVTAAGDTGHWDEDLGQARELLVANAFRAANPSADIRVLLIDSPMTHYGHIERPRQLAAVLLGTMRWLAAD